MLHRYAYEEVYLQKRIICPSLKERDMWHNVILRLSITFSITPVILGCYDIRIETRNTFTAADVGRKGNSLQCLFPY